MPKPTDRLPATRLNCEALEERCTPATGYALLADNSLVRFDVVNPTRTLAPVAITGLAAGDALVGIDIRPQNGLMYGLGYNATAGSVTLYNISPRTALATAVTPATPNQFVDGGGAPVRVGVDANTAFGFDFNPVADRIRVVTSNGQNFRLNPNTGAYADGDNVAAGVQMDTAISGATTSVDGTAYTDSVQNTGVTTQYTLSSALDALYIQGLTGSVPAGPNGGVLGGALAVTLGGNPLDFTAVNGFDILRTDASTGSSNDPATGTAQAILTVGGVTGYYSIDVATGVATLVGTFGTGTAAVRGLTLEEQSESDNLAAVALSADGANLLRFNVGNPTGAVTQAVDVSDLAASEVLVGIDYRPATGQLFGLAVNEAADTGSLYIVDPQTGDLTRVGASAGLVTFAGTDLPAGGYGFDFNPTVDRIRVTTATGLNFRLNPNTGVPAIATTDGAIAGLPMGSTGVSGTAYTNSFGQPLTGGVTTQYTLDAASDSLFIQNPPNNGTQTGQLALTDDTNPILFDDVNGFDIPAAVAVRTSAAPVRAGSTDNTSRAQNTGFAALTVGGTTQLFRINLGSGRASGNGNIGGGGPLAGLALGDNLDLNLSASFLTGTNAEFTNIDSRSNDGFSFSDAGIFVNNRSFGDAYDTFGGFRVNGTTFNPGQLADVTTTAAGTRVVSATAPIAGLSATQEFTFFDATATARIILSLQNTTGAAVSVPVLFFGELGSDGSSQIIASSPGSLTSGLRWFVNDDQQSTPDTGDPALSVVLAGPGGRVQAAPAAVGPETEATYNVTVAPGETIRLMTFTELFGPRAPALARTPVYDSTSAVEAAGLFAGLDAATRATIANWNFTAATADAGGPYTVPLNGTAVLTGTGPTGSTFEWDFDFDGTTFTTDATGANPAFFASGLAGGTVRTVAVRVTGPNGSTATDTATLTVSNSASTGVAEPDVAIAGPNGMVQVRTSDNRPSLALTPYSGFNGPVGSAVGDVTGDGIDDVITSTLAGSSHVKVFDGVTGAEVRSFFAFQGFTGGVRVSAVDLNGDGIDEILVGAGAGAPGGHVKVFDGVTGAQVRSFFAFTGYTGGVSVSGGDVTGDGVEDIVVGTLVGVAHVKAFNAAGAEVRSFFAFPGALGVNVAAVGGRIVTGVESPLALATPSEVRVYDQAGAVRSFVPYAGFTGSVRVSGDTDGRIVTGTGPGAGPHVKGFDPTTFAEVRSFFAFDAALTDGIIV